MTIHDYCPLCRKHLEVIDQKAESGVDPSDCRLCFHRVSTERKELLGAIEVMSIMLTAGTDRARRVTMELGFRVIKKFEERNGKAS